MWKEKNRLITAEKELATVRNKLFVNITESLDIKKDDSSLSSINYQNDFLEKFKKHSSVDKIRQKFMNDEKFSFKTVTEHILKERNYEFR